MASETMLKLGTFMFSLDTAAYDELRRQTNYIWAEQQRIGSTPVLQFVGKEAEQFTIIGRIYPHFKGGVFQIEAMRTMAGSGQPQLMVDGRGNIYGRMAIVSVLEGQKILFADGTPRLQEFTLTLRKYDDGEQAQAAFNSNLAQITGSGGTGIA